MRMPGISWKNSASRNALRHCHAAHRTDLQVNQNYVGLKLAGQLRNPARVRRFADDRPRIRQGCNGLVADPWFIGYEKYFHRRGL